VAVRRSFFTDNYPAWAWQSATSLPSLTTTARRSPVFVRSSLRPTSSGGIRGAPLGKAPYGRRRTAPRTNARAEICTGPPCRMHEAFWVTSTLPAGDRRPRVVCGSKQQKAPLARGFLERYRMGCGAEGRGTPSNAINSRTLFSSEPRHLNDYHSFQVSPAQYPRPLCSRKVMLGPGFQVSS
jgi:hypothetical protein